MLRSPDGAKRNPGPRIARRFAALHPVAFSGTANRTGRTGAGPRGSRSLGARDRRSPAGLLIAAPAPGLLAAVASRREGGRAVVLLRIAADDGALLGLAGFLLDVLATALRGFTLALAPALPRLGGGMAVAARLVGRARRRLARGLGIAGLLRVARRRSLVR